MPPPIIVTTEVSNRHVHLSSDHCSALFGSDQLKVFRTISQTGQFAAEQQLTVVGPNGSLENVRVVGPLRPQTQVELSRTDTRRLGVDAPVRDSGQLDETPGVTLVGPAGQVQLRHGVIVQRRHLHANPDDVRRYGLSSDQPVRVRVDGPRGGILDQVTVKIDPSFVWRLHLDTDEGNAFGVSTGHPVEVLL